MPKTAVGHFENPGPADQRWPGLRMNACGILYDVGKRAGSQRRFNGVFA